MTFYDSARQRAVGAATELLAGCDKSIEPLEGNEAGCTVCNARPDARRVWRKDGIEMAWASVCADHHDTELGVTTW